MINKEKIAPLPWATECGNDPRSPRTNVVDADGNKICYCQKEIDAKFIVQAVNSYYDKLMQQN